MYVRLKKKCINNRLDQSDSAEKNEQPIWVRKRVVGGLSKSDSGLVTLPPGPPEKKLSVTLTHRA